MAIHPLAGKPAPADVLFNVDELERAYYERVPNVGNPHELVSFGTRLYLNPPSTGGLCNGVTTMPSAKWSFLFRLWARIALEIEGVGVKPSSRWMAVYVRMDLPATAAQKRTLKWLRAETLTASQLAGEPIIAKLTKAPDNGAEIGGLKVAARSGWFAVRPSGTEDLCKIYAESLRSEEHLKRIQDEALTIAQDVFNNQAS